LERLVSLLIPAYNAQQTLPWVVASLQAQTYENWEAIVVDDGSTDGTQDYLRSVNDIRIRPLANDKNRGRGHSRQRAIDSARGTYIALLDADDWMFPDRIRGQVDALNSEQSVVLVSSGAAIVDSQEKLTGIRGLPEKAEIRNWRRIGPLPIVFAASMFRREAGIKHRFYEHYPLGEDSCFLMRMLLGNRFLMLPELAYAYREHRSASASKMALAHRYMGMIYLSHRRDFPILSLTLAAESFVKAAMWRTIGSMGMENRIIRNRSAVPTPEQQEQYRIALQTVSSHLRP
jgi:glycosyltransferase involved in cell wall biosynthesis